MEDYYRNGDSSAQSFVTLWSRSAFGVPYFRRLSRLAFRLIGIPADTHYQMQLGLAIPHGWRNEYQRKLGG